MPAEMKKVNHLDWWDSWDPTTKFEKTPEGYLLGRASVTSIGVFTYRNADGTARRELRLPEHVFDEASLSSLRGKPLTMDHPDVPITSENVAQFSIGTVSDTVFNTPYEVIAGVIVQKADAVAAVLSGKNAVSCGYDCDLIPATPGAMYHGSAYDYIQTNIRYNHLSVVDKARAGDQAKLRLDGFSIQEDRLDGKDKEKENSTMPGEMKTLHVDSVAYEAPVQVVVRFDAMQTELQTLRADAATKATALTTVTAERDAHKDSLTKITKELEDLKKTHVDSATAIAQVKARMELEAFAKGLKVEVKDGMSDRDLQVACIKATRPDRNLDGADDGYVKVYFDIVRKDAEDEAAGDQKGRGMNEPPKPNKDGASNTDGLSPQEKAAKARADYLNDLQNAHRGEKKE